MRSLIIGVHYDIKNQALAEKQLQHRQAKLQHHAACGNYAAVDRDLRCIDNLRYRIVIDEWLIRWNSLEYPDFYPIRTNAVSRAAIAQAATPIFVSFPWGVAPTPEPMAAAPTPGPMAAVPPPTPMAAAPTITVTIVNAEPAGAGVAFAINGVAYQSAAGSRQDLAVAPDANITYDSGGVHGPRRYLISPGVYEFRLSAEGWALYTLRGTP